jgi:hypothetical protein
MTPDKVHLVGSIALDSVEEVFRTAGRVLGRRLRRVPDGEPGGRRMWISWQYPFLRAQPFLRPDLSVPNPRGMPPLMLAENAAPAEIRFGELGYAREARISYQDFLAARERGELPGDVRFQVSLPTPLAVINPFIAAKRCPGSRGSLRVGDAPRGQHGLPRHSAPRPVHPMGRLHRNADVGWPVGGDAQSVRRESAS